MPVRTRVHGNRPVGRVLKRIQVLFGDPRTSFMVHSLYGINRRGTPVKHASGNLGRKIDAIPPLASSAPVTRTKKTVFFARDILAGQGYTVVRNTARHPPVDLVAWKPDGEPVLIQVRRTRRPFDSARKVAGTFHSDLKQLGRMPKPCRTRVQIWLYSFHQGWKTYDVHAGGLMEAEIS